MGEDGMVSKQGRLFNEVCSPNSPIAINSLIDALVALYEEFSKIQTNQYISSFLSKYKPVIQKINSMRVTSDDFELKKILGRGAFGEVNLVKCKLNDKYYAIKKLKKSEMLSRQEAFYAEERDLMALAEGKWIANLEYAFQDADYLYLVMEYLAGGNLLSYLYKEGNFEESTARFYIAETILGIQDIHKLGYVYRDLKPENILLDREGHIKLADFGSCYKLNEMGAVDSQVAVGTPDYIAPEVLRNNEGQSGSCGKESDWWSLGIVLYEMLCTEPPFSGSKMSETYSKIMNHKESFEYPSDVDLSDEVKDLINHLICDKEVRYGFEQIKSHPFFKNIDWDNLRSMKPPFVPELKHSGDTTYFEDEDIPILQTTSKSSKKQGENLVFIGYTFMRGLGQINSKEQLMAPSNQEDAKKYKDEAERWERMFNQEKQKSINDKLEAEKKIAEKEKEVQKKISELESEKKNRKLDQNKISSLEKEKIDLEFEIEQLKGRFQQLQVEKKAAEQISLDLQQQLEALLKKNETDVNEENLILEIQSLKSEIKTKEEISRQTEKRLSEIQEKMTNYEIENKKLSSNIEAEKERAEKLHQSWVLKNKDLHELESKKTELSQSISSLENEKRQMASEIARNKEKLQESERLKNEALNEKKQAELEKGKLEIELSLQKKKIDAKILKESELQAQIDQLMKTRSHNSQNQDSSIDQLTHEMNELKSQKNKLEDKVKELEKNIQDQDEKEAILQSKLRQESSDHQKLSTIVGNLEKSLEEKRLEEVKLSSQLSEIKMKHKELERKYQELRAIEKKEKEEIESLGSKLIDIKQKNSKLDVQLKRMTEKYEQEIESKQNLQVQLDKIRQKEGHIRRQSTQDFENNEIDIQDFRIQELQETIVSLRKEKAKVDLESAMNKKSAESERLAKHQLEYQVKDLTKEIEDLTNEKETIMDQVSELKQEIANLNEDLDYTEIENAKLKGDLSEKNKQIENLQVELDTAKSRNEASRSDVKEKKELRKLKEEYGILEMKSQNDEKARKDAENQLREEREKFQRLKNELDFYRSTVDQPKRERPASVVMKDAPLHSSLDYSKTLSQSQLKSLTSDDPSLFKTIKKKFSIKRAKADFPSNLSIPGSSSPASERETLEGILSIPKSNGAHRGWEKKYVVVKEGSIVVYDKKEKLVDGKVLVDLKAPVFSCREVPPGMIFTKPGELELLFMIQFKTNFEKTSISADFEANLSISGLQKKIQAIEKEIVVENALIQGFEKISQDTSKKRETKMQIEGSKKKVEQLKSHASKLNEELKVLEDRRMIRISQVENKIKSEKEYHQKLINIIPDDPLEKSKNDARIVESQQNIKSLEEELDKVKSNEEETIRVSDIHEFNGHQYFVKTFDSDTFCQFCSKLLLNRHGYWCFVCGYVCHKECHTLGNLSCSEKLSLADAEPLYFKAPDEIEKKKWIEGINDTREEIIKESAHPSSSPLTPKRD